MITIQEGGRYLDLCKAFAQGAQDVLRTLPQGVEVRVHPPGTHPASGKLRLSLKTKIELLGGPIQEISRGSIRFSRSYLISIEPWMREMGLQMIGQAAGMAFYDAVEQRLKDWQTFMDHEVGDTRKPEPEGCWIYYDGPNLTDDACAVCRREVWYG